MKLWIMYKSPVMIETFSPSEYMLEMAKNNGIDGELVYYESLALSVENKSTFLYYNGKLVTRLPDVAFIRGYPFEIIKYLEDAGVKIINGYAGMKLCKDKFETHKALRMLKDLVQPRTLFIKNGSFDFLKEKLNLPFVAKVLSGSGGEGVELITNEEELNLFKLNYDDSEFIFQNFIETSKKTDVRVYVIGSNVAGAIRRVATNDPFKANISLGGVSKKYELADRYKELAVKIAKKLSLEVCGLDFMFGEGDDLIFCEANGNAAFRGFMAQGKNIQNDIMKYIKEEYGEYKNIQNDIYDNKNRANSFVIKNGARDYIISAPHAVSQRRNGKYKGSDLNTDKLAYYLHQNHNSTAIIKTKNTGSAEKDDDANFQKESPYKTALINLVKKTDAKIVIDVHSMKKERLLGVIAGISGGENIKNDEEFKKFVYDTFSDFYAIKFDFDGLYGSENTIANSVAKSTNAYGLQLEINTELLASNHHMKKLAELIAKIPSYFK